MKPVSVFLLLFLFATTCGFLCSKKDSPANPNPPGPSNGIYAIYSTGFQHMDRTAGIWHDGTSTTLLNRGSKVYLNDMAIAPNGDVYVAGCECTWDRNPPPSVQKDDSCKITLWKNNVRQELTKVPYSSITEAHVFVTGAGDVYVAGSENIPSTGAGKIRLWKNGVPQDITNNTVSAMATSLFVNGNDVYIGGNQKPVGEIKTTATLWKNGVPQKISGNTSYFDEISAIQVSGTDVYTAVREAGSGWLAKNGVKQAQPSGIKTIRDIFLSGTDLYVLGNTNNTTTSVWKNGNLLYNLTYTGILDYYDGGQSMYVKDGDVYVAGVTTINGSENAVIWKNGSIIHTMVKPGMSLTTAEAIIVK